MKEILGTKYITQKEACVRFGLSSQWFERARANGTGPMYFRLRGKGPVFYDLERTDKWFKDNMIEGE